MKPVKPTILDYAYDIDRIMFKREVDEYFRILDEEGEPAADRYRRSICTPGNSISTSKLKLQWPRGTR